MPTVTDTVQFKWNINAARSGSFQILYHLKLSSSIALSFALQAPVSSSIAIPYNIHQTVSGWIEAKFKIREKDPVSGSVIFPAPIAPSLTKFVRYYFDRTHGL